MVDYAIKSNRCTHTLVQRNKSHENKKHQNNDKKQQPNRKLYTVERLTGTSLFLHALVVVQSRFSSQLVCQVLCKYASRERSTGLERVKCRALQAAGYVGRAWSLFHVASVMDQCLLHVQHVDDNRSAQRSTQTAVHSAFLPVSLSHRVSQQHVSDSRSLRLALRPAYLASRKTHLLLAGAEQ